METIVLSAQNRPKGGWPAPGMSAWQGDGYTLRQTSSDVSEQMHAIGGLYLPADMLPYGSHIITEKHFSFVRSKVESGLSTYNNMKYPTACTWHHRTPSSQLKHQSRDINWGVQGCRPGSALCAQTINYEIMGQVICRYSSSCLVSRKSLDGVLPERDELPVYRSTSLARASSLTHSLHWQTTSKQSSNRTSTGRKERPPPATQKFRSCKGSDDCARGVLYMEDDVHIIPFEPMHNRLANKAPQSAEKIDCNMPQTASLECYEILSKRANCIKKYGRESLTSMDDAPPGRIKEGQEGECSSLNAGEAKAINCQSRTRSKKDSYKDHCDGLMPFDPIVTSASTIPLAVKGFSQEGSQSAHSPPMNERWAGPAFSNSPPPSSLPVPSFARRQSKTSSLEIP